MPWICGAQQEGEDAIFKAVDMEVQNQTIGVPANTRETFRRSIVGKLYFG